jgi:hypothetical protein
MTSEDTTPENNLSDPSMLPQGNEERQEESQNEKGKVIQDLINNGQLVKDLLKKGKNGKGGDEGEENEADESESKKSSG